MTLAVRILYLALSGASLGLLAVDLDAGRVLGPRSEIARAQRDPNAPAGTSVRGTGPAYIFVGYHGGK